MTLPPSGGPEVIVPDLPQGAGQLPGKGHWTRDVAFSADGTAMYVSVGSYSNVQERGEDETDRAAILSFDPEGGKRRIFASGLRNPVSLSISPVTGGLWTTVNERDALGDQLVPDYVTRVRRGEFYGWPWFYIGTHPDKRPASAVPVRPAHGGVAQGPAAVALGPARHRLLHRHPSSRPSMPAACSSPSTAPGIAPTRRAPR